jgi:NitT/TauT family transport system permease protein
MAEEETKSGVKRIIDILEGPRIKVVLVTMISLAIFVAAWWVVAIFLDLAYLPTPDKVLEALIDSFSRPDPNLGIDMWQNIGTSLYRFIAGFCLALVLAVPLGLVMGFSRLAEMLATPIIEVFRPIPPIAWVPFLFIVFGFILGPIITIFIGVFFPVLSNVFFGVKSVDKILLDVGRTQGANKLQLFTKVILPYTVPFLMTGVRIGLGIGWMCIVAAEIIGGVGGGVGFYIQLQADLSRFTYMFAGMIVVAILGILTTGLAGYVEKVTRRRMGFT